MSIPFTVLHSFINGSFSRMCNRLRYGPSLMCMTKKEATQEVSTLRWLGRTLLSASVDHAPWLSMTWATATTPTVTPGWTRPSLWSSPSSSLRGWGTEGSGRRLDSTVSCHCHLLVSECVDSRGSMRGLLFVQSYSQSSVLILLMLIC
jgi:hypothetical protein